MTRDRNVTLERRGAVATVSFGRKAPAAEYAAMAQEALFLLDVATSEAQAVVLNIVGERFFPADAAFDDEALQACCDPIIGRIRDAPAAIVAAVEGAATGGGCAIALACDFILASDTASFAWQGRSTHEGSDHVWARILSAAAGQPHAKAIVRLSRPISAMEARSGGLVNRVAPGCELASLSTQVAARLAWLPHPSLHAAKKICRAGAAQSRRNGSKLLRASKDAPQRRGPSPLH